MTIILQIDRNDFALRLVRFDFSDRNPLLVLQKKSFVQLLVAGRIFWQRLSTAISTNFHFGGAGSRLIFWGLELYGRA